MPITVGDTKNLELFCIIVWLECVLHVQSLTLALLIQPNVALHTYSNYESASWCMCLMLRWQPLDSCDTVTLAQEEDLTLFNKLKREHNLAKARQKRQR
jgi:hypothetical protein